MEVQSMGPMPPPFKKPNAEQISGQVISTLDTDGDGTLSTSEIEQAEGNAQGLLAADANEDGSVSQQELVDKVRSLFESLEANKPTPQGPGQGNMPPPHIAGDGARPPGGMGSGDGKAELMQRLQDNGSDDAMQLLSILQNTGIDRYA